MYGGIPESYFISALNYDVPGESGFSDHAIHDLHAEGTQASYVRDPMLHRLPNSYTTSEMTESADPSSYLISKIIENACRMCQHMPP